MIENLNIPNTQSTLFYGKNTLAQVTEEIFLPSDPQPPKKLS